MSGSSQSRPGLLAETIGTLALGYAATVNAGNSQATSSSANACLAGGRPALQVLGSSGPLNAEGRASTSYLLWLAGRPAILVDVGPGSTVNLARTGANPTDLDAILLSHLHPDHVSDLPGLLWDEEVLERNRPMLIVGPAGNRYFPDTKVFLQRLFGGAGAFPEMQAILQPFSAFHLEVRVSNIAPLQPSRVATIDGIEISAYPVPHGRAPSLAYRLEGAGF